MKYAIIFASVAALVGALPQCQPATTEANDSNPTAVKVEAKKLPFIESGAFGGIYCSMRRPGTWFDHTDKDCGTERFCKGFDDQEAIRKYLKAEPKYKNAEACFDDHEPRSS